MGTLLVVLIIALCVGLVLRGMIRDRKAGKSACGGCSGDCAHCGTHMTQE